MNASLRLPIFGASLISLCLVACAQSTISAADSSDYAIQGEYVGINSTTGTTMGAQVMALGSKTFQLLLLTGGLPGQGWDSQNRKILPGSTQGNPTFFSQSSYALTINSTGDSLRGANDLGQMLRLVKVHRQSSSLGQAAPSGAMILFDGTSLSAWNNGVIDSNHNLIANASSTGIVSKQSFGDFTLHLEFNVPYEPTATGQNRGNSGVYLQNRYELQILDSFGQSLQDLALSDSIEPRRQCGAFYEQVAPATNMSFPPLVWQTYDIDFTAARWNSSGSKIQNAVVTVRQNGISIHSNQVLSGSTLQGDAEAPTSGPILLQYHGHTVLFRNIWILDKNNASSIPSKPLERHGSIRTSPHVTRYALAVQTRFKTSFFSTPDGRIVHALY